MKKLGFVVVALGAATVQATAADLARRPVVAPAPMVVPVFSWTGFYVGANVGGAWSSTTITSNITGANWKPSNTTFIGGGQLGYNYQWPGSNWVIGAEWTFDWGGGDKTSNVRGEVTDFSRLRTQRLSVCTRHLKQGPIMNPSEACRGVG